MSTSKTFTQNRPSSRDYGEPSRFLYQVFDDDGGESHLVREGTEWIVTGIDKTRYQVKVLISREAGRVVDLWIQKVPEAGAPALAKDVLRLRRDDARRLVDFMQRLDLVEPDGAEIGTHLDEAIIADILNNPEAASTVYEAHSDIMRALIQTDANAKDLVALSGRKAALREFRKLLDDDGYFQERADEKNGPESVWQELFQANPWVLGIGLGSQLLTAWSDDRLEQVVAGATVGGVGKRADALMRTAGAIRSMVFAEIKHHNTPLLNPSAYRPGIYAPSKELSGGIAQAQGTVHRAVAHLGASLASKDKDGFETLGDVTYLLQPRSFLVIGRLSEFLNDSGAHHPDKIVSFELHRRNVHEPEIVTFDELLARAEWLVEEASS
jgi:hypothetical protein